MKRREPSRWSSSLMSSTRVEFTAISLFLLQLFAISAHAGIEPELTRAERVFPFEVGQQCEFQSMLTFTRPNGDSLPLYTVAQITVTDTTINDTTYLHVPYWSPHGSEYYRFDDSLIVWNRDIPTGEERIYLRLGSDPRAIIGGVPVEESADCCIDSWFDVHIYGPPGLDKGFHWGYRESVPDSNWEGEGQHQ